MPIDPYQNARPYYDLTFPSSGDSFSLANMKNALQGIGFLDMIPGQPRAHSPGDMRIMIRGRDSSSFFNPFYYGDADQRIAFTSGDSPSMSAPASNPRLDIVYLTPSGDIRVVTGPEATTPSLPSLSPSGDTRLPICAVYHKTTETKIVNFEDKDSNTGDGYIYQDLRPWIRTKSVGAQLTVSSIAALSVTGDNAAGSSANISRYDHTHQGVHAIRKVGSSNLFGDVEFAGSITQAGNRLTIDSVVVQMVNTQTGAVATGTTTVPDDDTIPQNTEGDQYMSLSITPKATSNILIIQVVAFVSSNNTATAIGALFQDTTADAIATGREELKSSATSAQGLLFTHKMTAGTTSATTFKVRIGAGGAGTITFNGAGGARLFGGTMASSITIWEISA